MLQAQKAQTLASEIRNQASQEEIEGATLRSVNSIYGPLHHGPGVEAALQNEPMTKPAKTPQDLGLWLDTISLRSVAEPIRSHGFGKPADLLHFLMDFDAYDSFVDACGIKAFEARVLWKALESLDVVLTPRNDSQGPGLSAKDEAAARQNVLRLAAVAAEEGTRIEVQEAEEREEEAKAVRAVLLGTADNDERARQFVKRNAHRIMHLAHAVEKQEHDMRRVEKAHQKERRRKIQNTIHRMNLTVLFRYLFLLLCTCIYIYIYIYICVCMYIHIHVYIHIDIYVYR